MIETPGLAKVGKDTRSDFYQRTIHFGVAIRAGVNRQAARARNERPAAALPLVWSTDETIGIKDVFFVGVPALKVNADAVEKAGAPNTPDLGAAIIAFVYVKRPLV